MLQPKSVAAPVFRGALLLGTVLLLCGCVTEVGYQPPYNQVSSGGEVSQPPGDEVSSGGEVSQPPPQLPEYGQPPCPGDGYLWVPGYWAYSGGYYWVPGTWVLPPQVGLLWTPGYWGFAGGAYIWHAGYWGPHVGFYGGVHYGYGYDGDGYRGGRWEGPHFVYNSYVTHVDEHVVRYTYNERVDDRFDDDRVSYEGGRGGRVAYPTREDLRYEHEEHMPATPSQRAHIEQAERNPAFFARENNGHPPIAATPRPGLFEDRDVERARGADRFEPQDGRPNAELRPNFQSRPNAQERAYVPVRENAQAGPQYQTPPAPHGQGWAAQHPQPRQDYAPQRPQPRQDYAPQRPHPQGYAPPQRPQSQGYAPPQRPQSQPHQGFAPRSGPTGHPQGRPAPEKDRRSHQRDH